MDSKELSDSKAEFRKQAFVIRERAWRADPKAGDRLKRQLLEAIAVPPGIEISGYWPLAGEMDVLPALSHYNQVGHQIGLPVIVGKNQPLLFRAWSPDTVLIKGDFSVMTPPCDAPEIVPKLILVPLLAFDPDGYRLGYGGGFYDRTLAKLRHDADAIAIGVAYAAQEMPVVPRGPFDQPLDFVVTEHSIFKFKDKSGI